MKARRLNKKGLTARELILFILAIGVLVLMFWGPLGTWWKQLSDKYGLFQESIDHKISDLQLLGLKGTSEQDLKQIASTEKGLTQILETAKKELENKCVENQEFEDNVQKFMNGIAIELQKSKIEAQNIQDYVCQRLYTCFNRFNLNEIQKYNHYSLASMNCKSNKNEVTFNDYIDKTKSNIKGLEGNNKFEEAGSKCGEFSRYGMLDYDYFDSCARRYNLLIPSKTGLFWFIEKPTDPFCVNDHYFKFGSKEKVSFEISFYLDDRLKAIKTVLCNNGCNINLFYTTNRGGSRLDLPKGEYTYLIKASDDLKEGKINIKDC